MELLIINDIAFVYWLALQQEILLLPKSYWPVRGEYNFSKGSSSIWTMKMMFSFNFNFDIEYRLTYNFRIKTWIWYETSLNVCPTCRLKILKG